MDLLTAKTILIAEDEDFTRRVLAAALTRLGARVIECVDGQHALNVLGERRVDIALLGRRPGRDKRTRPRQPLYCQAEAAH